MAPATDKETVPPLAVTLRSILLPELAVKLIFGARCRVDGDQALMSFEDDLTQLHLSDLEAAKEIADRVAGQLPKRKSPGTVLQAMSLARQAVAQEIFRPGAVRVLYYSVMSKASAFYRCLTPLYALNLGGKAVAHASSARFGSESLDYDVIVVQIDNSPSALEFVVALQAAGKKVVYEIDDAFDCLEPWHPQYASYGQKVRQDAIVAMMAQADAVTVSTQWMADRYRRHAKEIEVIPNLLELAAWPQADRLRRDGLFKVMWAGSPSHSGDLEIAIPALGRFAKRHQDVRVVFFGQTVKDGRIPEGQLENIDLCEFEEFPFKHAAIDADVAIAPLADVAFNYGKSNLRVLQYWATGYPVIASPVGPYGMTVKDGVDGLFAKTDADWEACLERLYQNRGLRSSLAAEGLEAVKAYDVLGNAKKVEQFYRDLCGK